ncbi:MAG: DEAD/DEAH box helicase [Myxococcota bacterium]|nr:DEAD/DEAH box helicase [Myxococcota bacterium]
MNTRDCDTEQGTAADLPCETQSFDDFDLHRDVERAIKEIGFETPTPVQAQTYDTIMDGRDVIVMAQTGTGKTAAFGIPIVQRLDPKDKGIAALALTPTRELALQVSKELSAIGKYRDIRCATVYGGASFTKQVAEVKQGARIVVGTPGRVLDHIRSRSISFAQVGLLVLDEADEMLSMGFEKEISEIIESLPKERQNLLFSATIPDDIRRLTQRYLDDAAIISVSGDAVAAKEISHFVYLVSGQGRQRDMVRILEAERPDSAIIFCNTRDETQLLARHLKSAGFNADWLNSDLSQHDREIIMARTRKEEIKYLVATDVAARGIDVSHLSHVINYSFPDSLEIYIHRTGRTGRMGRQGTAISLITPQDIGNLYYLRLTYKIYPIEKTLVDDAAEARNTEIDQLIALRQGFGAKLQQGFGPLARRVIQDVYAERIVAGLLGAYFDQQMGAALATAPQQAEEKPAPTQAKPKTAAPPRKDRSARPKAQKTDKKRPKTDPSKEKPEKKSNAPDTLDTDTPLEEIFIDAGRKDGLRISHLMQEIVQITGLPRTSIGKVRMLTRSTFITVPEDHFSTVLKAIGKIEVEGRPLKAEPSQKS